MARTPKYWYDIMIAEKNTFSNLNIYQPNIDSAQTLLADLTSQSKVAIWRLQFWCVASAMFALDVVFDLYKIYLEAIAAKSRYGTLPWYISVAKEFQYGDSLTLIDLEWRYATVNPASQIISLAAAQEGVGVVNLKIATLSGLNPTPISAPQYVAFTAYIKKKAPAGIIVNIINDNADELQLFITATFDPLVLTIIGELISAPGTFPLRDAVAEYLNEFGGEDGFNSGFEIMRLEDKMQNALGIDTVYVTAAFARYGANPYVAFNQRYLPNAGYMIIDPGTPLSSSVTYVPNV
ncbi:hypothetical protein [Aurantibacillus circumpalustris]|uniref:hypothetical protein n=1 Tax=Aurantibacillus circumpalustris TaxID=3036359 RepID=UPI00295B819D|nr:hypothetical protein [Aurantibacillus circumpalustris]